jgi:hypothetical protein
MLIIWLGSRDTVSGSLSSCKKKPAKAWPVDDPDEWVQRCRFQTRGVGDREIDTVANAVVQHLICRANFLAEFFE